MDEDKIGMVNRALRKAWQLGQTYWQQADSEYFSQHKKAAETHAEFQQLVAETRAAMRDAIVRQGGVKVRDNYKPTADIKWFRVEGNHAKGNKPLAQIAGYPECGPEWFCLKQRWCSDSVGEDDEWRDIEVVA